MALSQTRVISPVCSTSSAVPRSHSTPSTSCSPTAKGWKSVLGIRGQEVGNLWVQQDRDHCSAAAVRIAAEGYEYSENDGDEGVPSSGPDEIPRENLMITLAPPRSIEKLAPYTKEAARGIIIQAVLGKGWITGSGLEGPAVLESSEPRDSASSEGNEWPSLTRSPRRRMRVAFTCNVCGHRTTRAINPHAYTDGTVFVQCGGCDVFHKLVDNLNLFHELKGRVFPSYVDPGFAYHEPYDYLKFDEYLG